MYHRLSDIDTPFFVHEWKLAEAYKLQKANGAAEPYMSRNMLNIQPFSGSNSVLPRVKGSDRPWFDFPTSRRASLQPVNDCASGQGMGNVSTGLIGMKDECVSGAYGNYMSAHSEKFKGKTVLHVCCGSGKLLSII